MAIQDILKNLMLEVTDPEAPIPELPALTTLLYRVCDSDYTKFAEATRLIELFATAAYAKGQQNPN